MSSLSIAQLAIYILLSGPVLFILYKHGRPGLLGWIYLFAFCTLRIVGSALSIKGSSSANLVANIGLSPLILATSGILHEARDYLKADKNRKIGWALVLLFKIFVLGGLGLLVAGSSALQGTNATESDFTLVKVGISIITISWVILSIWTVLTLSHKGGEVDHSAARAGKQLAWAIFFALIFIGIRVIYTLAAMVTKDPNLSPSTGSLTIRVLLSFLPELVGVLIFIAAGWMTRHARRDTKAKRTGHERVSSEAKDSYPLQGRRTVV